MTQSVLRSPESDASRVSLLGCPIHRLGIDDTVALCETLIEQGSGARHVCVNAAKLVAFQKDPVLRRSIEACEVVSADGQAIVWATRLLGDPLPERVAGIDLMWRLLALAETRGYGVYFLGARDSVLNDVRSRLGRDFPNLVISGYQHGYFTIDEQPSIAERIRRAKPDILFVALPSPAKEYWLDTFAPELAIPLSMGVGGSLDVLAGVTRRAPRVMQRLGLEWLFRMAQEPRRMFRRYATTNVRFIALVSQALVRRSLATGLLSEDRRQAERRERERLDQLDRRGRGAE